MYDPHQPRREDAIADLNDSFRDLYSCGSNTNVIVAKAIVRMLGSIAVTLAMMLDRDIQKER